jgi:hypothetical protein
VPKHRVARALSTFALVASIVIGVAGIVLPGAIAAQAADACFSVDPANVMPAVTASSLIVVAHVDDASATAATLAPEAFLKGPVGAGAIHIEAPDPGSGCTPAQLTTGDRVLVFLAERTTGGIGWPAVSQVFVLRGGRAYPAGSSADSTITESSLVDSVRTVTNQHLVPPATASESEGINWSKTIVPIGATLIGLMVVGLFLMRIWHRIDPS